MLDVSIVNCNVIVKSGDFSLMQNVSIKASAFDFQGPAANIKWLVEKISGSLTHIFAHPPERAGITTTYDDLRLIDAHAEGR